MKGGDDHIDRLLVSMGKAFFRRRLLQNRISICISLVMTPSSLLRLHKALTEATIDNYLGFPGEMNRIPNGFFKQIL